MGKRYETTDKISSVNIMPYKLKEEYLIYTGVEISTGLKVHKLVSTL